MGIQFLKDLENQIFSDIQADNTIKEQFTKDPTNFLKTRYQIVIPDGITINVYQDTDTVKNIVLPYDQEPLKAW